MAELVRGSIADRPWGLTFSQFGLRAVTGQLTLRAVDGKEYRVAFEGGSIVGATSPQAADSATRVALTANLITSSQVANITRQIAARAGDDEIEVLAQVCKLDIMQSLKLRRRVTVQRAARTFSIENGTFVLDDEITIPTAYDAAVDIRAVVLQGAKMNLSEVRLLAELRDLGSHFTLVDASHVEEFGIDPTALPIVDALRTGSSVAEIEARHRDLDPRTVQSVVYALVVCRDAKVTSDAKPAAPVSVAFKPKSGEHSAVPRTEAKLTDSGTQRRLGAIIEVDARPRTPSGPQTIPRPIIEVDARPRTPSGMQPIVDSPSARITPPPDRPRAGTGPRAIAELEIDGPKSEASQHKPTQPMPLDARAPAAVSVPEPPRTSTKKAGTELRPPAPAAVPTAPEPPRTATQRPSAELKPPARPPIPADEPAASDSFSGPVVIGLPGLEEEPTKSRNLVGGDFGPPDIPERTPPTPVVGRVSSAFDFLDPSSAVMGGGSAAARHEEPTLRSVDVARIAGTPPEMPKTRMTPAIGVPSIPPPTPASVDRSRPPTNPRLPVEPRPPAAPPERARPPASNTGSFPADRSRSPTNSPAARTNPPSGSFPIADRPRSPSVAPADRSRPPTTPPTSPQLRPKTPTAQRLPAAAPPRARSSTLPPSDGAPAEVAVEYSEGRRALAEAAEAYAAGQQALRDGQTAVAVEQLTRASTLNPHEFDHSALLAWAQCLAASPADRPKAAEKARKMLTHATQKSQHPDQARFHLGQLERLLGRNKDALVLFQAVLRTIPDHAGAKAEIAALEDKADKSLFGLFKKKT